MVSAMETTRGMTLSQLHERWRVLGLREELMWGEIVDADSAALATAPLRAEQEEIAREIVRRNVASIEDVEAVIQYIADLLASHVDFDGNAGLLRSCLPVLSRNCRDAVAAANGAA